MFTSKAEQRRSEHMFNKLTNDHLEQIKKNIPNDKSVHQIIDEILEKRKKSNETN